MTREEQIDKFAQSKMDCEFWNESLYEGIKIGAKWADRNPKDGLVSIDKVCEWLALHISSEDIFDDETYLTVNLYDNMVDFIKAFRKAMEE